MSSSDREYSVGDWIVHCRYGVGKVIGIEQKPIYDGKKTRKECYKVETDDGNYWFAIEQRDNPRVRPLSSLRVLRRALKALNEPPQFMDASKSEIKQRISMVNSNAELEPLIQLVRELFARNQHNNLNVDEDRALAKYTKHLISEYSISAGIEVTDARKELYAMLNDSNQGINEKYFFGLGNSS